MYPKSQVRDLPCNGMPHFGVSLGCLMSPQALARTSNYWDPHIGVHLGCLVSPQTQEHPTMGSPHRSTPGLSAWCPHKHKNIQQRDPHIGVLLDCLVSTQTQEHPTTGKSTTMSTQVRDQQLHRHRDHQTPLHPCWKILSGQVLNDEAPGDALENQQCPCRHKPSVLLPPL